LVDGVGGVVVFHSPTTMTANPATTYTAITPPPRSGLVQQVETRNPYQPPCFHALFYIQPQPRDRRSPSLIGLRAL